MDGEMPVCTLQLKKRRLQNAVVVMSEPTVAPYPTLPPRPLVCGNLKCIQPHNPGTYSKSAPGQCWGGPRVLYQYSRVRGPNPDLTPAAGRIGGQLGAD